MIIESYVYSVRIIILSAAFALISMLSIAQDQHNVELLGHWFREDLPINYRNARFSEVFAVVNDGVEYAVIASTMGAHFVEIPDELFPTLTEVEFIPGTFQGFGVNHRDYDVIDNYLFAVADQAPALLQIVDFSLLPDTAMVVYESDELFSTAHNIRMDQENRRAYVCGPSGHAMCILDVVDPENPVLLAHFDLVPYVHDCYIRDHVAWLNCGNQGLFVFDFTDPLLPVLLGTLEDYPEQGYNHQGWLNAAGDIYAFTDETEGLEMKVCDVSDLSDIEVLDTFSSESDTTAIPHNLYIIDDMIFVSHYGDGLQIYNFSNPNDVKRVAWYDTSEEPNVCCNGMWGVYPFLPSGRIVASDRQNGLFVFRVDLDDPTTENQHVAVGPNPGHGIVSLDFFEQSSQGVEITCFDATGKLCAKFIWNAQDPIQNRAELDLSFLSDGFYTLTFIGDEFNQSVNYMKISK